MFAFLNRLQISINEIIVYPTLKYVYSMQITMKPVYFVIWIFIWGEVKRTVIILIQMKELNIFTIDATMI